MIKVSIIVPVYNVEEYIDKCLDSLVNQTLKEIEIIIVNDGATDNSADVIRKYTDKYKDKIIYLEKENGGLSDARNFGLPYAKGEYIAFLDSDDYVDIKMYETMYNKAKEEDADMVECDFYWSYPNKDKLDTGAIYNGKKEMMVTARVVAWNKLIKKSIIKESKVIFPKGLRYEDAEFFYKILPYINKVSFVKEPFIYYIQRQTSISNTQNEKTKEIFSILNNVLQYYKENNLFDEYKKELEYNYIRYLLGSSFLRMIKIPDKSIRKVCLDETWGLLNNTFPNWKENEILNKNKGLRNIYFKTVSKSNIYLYAKIFRIIKGAK